MGGGGVTIHHYLPAAITFITELRLMQRLRLHEACSVLFDSIPLGRCRFKRGKWRSKCMSLRSRLSGGVSSFRCISPRELES
ncbi:hypothetical protein PIB30_068630 [Stylosanthes scabra]|uniref:Uncharacterized protein n=1 Tax=Stylosanthes scabra TaxID=79078 RepID=A0ABU6TQ68_9FABA|nr:hypothetical protein [Stylosanthes scabra]